MLSDVKVAKLKYDGESGAVDKHSDRDGLYLAVSPPRKSDPRSGYGSKAWRYDYRWPPTREGQRLTLTFGRYPELTLAEAREKLLEARRAILNGINPSQQKQDQKRALLSSLGNTYGKISAKWFAFAKHGKSASWLESQSRWQKLILKTLNSKPIINITHDDVYNAVKPLEDEGHAFSADRARQQIAQVFAFAIRKRVPGLTSNPAHEIKGEIKTPKTQNHRHFKAPEIPAFLATVDASQGADQTKRAAKLLLLTIVRKQELCAAKRTELDLNAGIWEIPGERMKNGIPHLVPLAPQVVALFKQQIKEAGKHEYVFPNSQRADRPMGLSTLNVFFDRIGYGETITPHGLRSVASTQLNGTGAFRPDVIERQLSHVDRNKIRASYNKSDYLEERKKMMAYWADFCEGRPADSNVVDMLKGKAA